jgi:plasmid stabilization system protein ParE
MMPRGDKSKYTGKQERKAEHIAESYESRGVPENEAERRAWATVNKESGGGKKAVPAANPTFRRKRVAGLAAKHRPDGQRRSVQPRPRRQRRRAVLRSETTNTVIAAENSEGTTKRFHHSNRPPHIAVYGRSIGWMLRTRGQEGRPRSTSAVNAGLPSFAYSCSESMELWFRVAIKRQRR